MWNPRLFLLIRIFIFIRPSNMHARSFQKQHLPDLGRSAPLTHPNSPLTSHTLTHFSPVPLALLLCIRHRRFTLTQQPLSLHFPVPSFTHHLLSSVLSEAFLFSHLKSQNAMTLPALLHTAEAMVSKMLASQPRSKQ